LGALFASWKRAKLAVAEPKRERREMINSQDEWRWYSDQVDWFRQLYYLTPADKAPPLLQHNGWFGVGTEEHPGFPTLLKAINRSGNILDLGCGNGLLLRTLIECASHKLVPFGVDFLPESIAEARGTILPAFKENFWTGNIASFDFGKRLYTYILICPAYLHEEVAESFLSECLEHLEVPGGKLILYEYCDVNIVSDYQNLVRRSGETLQGFFEGDNTTRIMCFEL
jgi:SAM-dependent methyltransferase